MRGRMRSCVRVVNRRVVALLFVPLLHAATVRVVDPLGVSAERPAGSAVVTLTVPADPPRIRCDILIIGGSTGGVAAALAAARGSRSVCLTEETNWVGGQFTAQGVSALDENRYIETTGATALYAGFRQRVRDYYRAHYQLSAQARAEKHLNPGACWVSALCFEANAGLQALEQMLEPLERAGTLHVYLRTKAVAAKRTGRHVDSVLTYNFETRQFRQFEARYVLDATDLGELLPLLDLDFTQGAESRAQTGEPDAPLEANRADIQRITYPFVLKRGGNAAPISKPAGYEHFKATQPYSLVIDYGHGKRLTYSLFEKAPGTPGSFWEYRRLTASFNFQPGGSPPEFSMVNWPANDYCAAGLLSSDPLAQAEALQSAKRVSLGFAWWLQHESGYSGFALARDALGSMDGLSQFPYIRESRRIHALTTIREQQISAADQKGSRAARFADSVGIGLYPIDVHTCTRTNIVAETKPFQIPLGALIPRDVDNLLAASKNIGTTHITNGAYRLHPVEWAIGEAAGTAALFAVESDATPAEIDRTPCLLEQLQRKLLAGGAPIYWFDDLLRSDRAFAAVQLAATRGVLKAGGIDLHAPNSSSARETARAYWNRAGGCVAPHLQE
jgi:hypothetical protein